MWFWILVEGMDVIGINSPSAINILQAIFFFLFLRVTVVTITDGDLSKQTARKISMAVRQGLGKLAYWLKVHAVRSIWAEATPNEALLLPSYAIMDMM